MSNKTLHQILLVGLGLTILIFFLTMFQGLSLLSAKSHDLVDLKAQAQTADAQLSNLVKAKKDVEKYSYFKSVAQTVIPNDKDQAETVLTLNQIANQSGIQLQSITFPTSTLGGSATTPSSADAATSSSSRVISQAKPVSGISGLYSLKLTVTADNSKTLPVDQQVTYSKILNFLSLVEKNRRTAQIAQVDIQPSSDSPSLSFSLIINIFMKP